MPLPKVSCRLEPELKRQLEQRARASGLSTSQVIVAALTAHFTADRWSNADLERQLSMLMTELTATQDSIEALQHSSAPALDHAIDALGRRVTDLESTVRAIDVQLATLLKTVFVHQVDSFMMLRVLLQQLHPAGMTPAADAARQYSEKMLRELDGSAGRITASG